MSSSAGGGGGCRLRVIVKRASSPPGGLSMVGVTAPALTTRNAHPGEGGELHEKTGNKGGDPKLSGAEKGLERPAAEPRRSAAAQGPRSGPGSTSTAGSVASAGASGERSSASACERWTSSHVRRRRPPRGGWSSGSSP